MKQKFDNFSLQEAQRLAKTDAGRQLAALFHQQGNAEITDMEQMKKVLTAFMQDPKAKELVRQLQEEQHGRTGK